MKPTKISLFIVAMLVAATFVSCGNKSKTVEETHVDESADLNFEYTDSGEELFLYYMPRDQWPQDTFFSDMVEVYNASVLLHGVRSVIDVWKRYEDSETALKSLKYADINKISSKDIKERFTQCLNLAQRFFAEHIDTSDSLLYRQLSGELNSIDSTLATRYHISNYSNFSDEKYWSALDCSKQSHELFDKLSTETITPENIDTKEVQKDIAFIVKKIEEQKDFNKKCAYTMEYVYWVGFYNTDFKLVEKLLDDGQYSPYLFFLWRIWRCGVQLVDENYGPSTWSEIPNKLYNEKRLKIAKTTLKHIATHRDDCVAINQYLITATLPNILRIGEFDLGNESFTELYYLDLGRK